MTSLTSNLTGAGYDVSHVQFGGVARTVPPTDDSPGALVGPDGAVALSTPLRKALFVGDSITAYAEVVSTTTAVTNLGNGTANIQRTSHSWSVGQKTRIAAAADPALNVMSATILSITDANNAVGSLDGPTHTVSGAAPVVANVDRGSTRGWVSWLETMAGEPMDRTWAAIPGARIEDITDLLPKLTPGYEDVAYICIGMNNVYSAADSLATMQGKWAAMIPRVKERSGRLVVLSIPPRNSADPAWSEAKQTVHTQFNRWLYEQCDLNGWEFVDTWLATSGGATYVDPAAANPDPLAAMVFDNTHPSMRGAHAIGAAVWDKVSKWQGVDGWRAPHPDAIGADAGNLLTTSDFAVDTAGVANNWVLSDSSGSITATPTMENRTVANDGDACGRNQVLTMSALGASNIRFRRNNIQALLTAGQRYYLAIPFSVADATGLVGLEVVMFGAVGSNFWLIFGHNQDSNADAMVGDFSGWLLTPIATCPAGLTDLDIWVRPYLTAAQSGNLTLKLWQPQLRLVD